MLTFSSLSPISEEHHMSTGTVLMHLEPEHHTDTLTLSSFNQPKKHLPPDLAADKEPYILTHKHTQAWCAVFQDTKALAT
jgi:hypothetical protein